MYSVKPAKVGSNVKHVNNIHKTAARLLSLLFGSCVCGDVACTCEVCHTHLCTREVQHEAKCLSEDFSDITSDSMLGTLCLMCGSVPKRPLKRNTADSHPHDQHPIK
jgi:hypothetical protein